MPAVAAGDNRYTQHAACKPELRYHHFRESRRDPVASCEDCNSLHENAAMWKHAEVVGLIDRSGLVRAVSRNEEEAVIKHVVGRSIRRFLAPASREAFEEAFQAALDGREAQALLAGVADDGSIVWGRVQLKKSPEPTAPVLLHMRRLPRSWARLSHREKAVIEALNASEMNSKRAAKQLGISLHTLNSHRRSICRKCRVSGVGEFWIFVEHCR